MSLSVCLLTRNEERNITRAVRSFGGVADQILVVDTGSTDRTAELAREAGAEVRHFVWNDDFSAGRNFAIRQATGDWILWLNPDEELLPESHEELRRCLTGDDSLGYYVHVQELEKADSTELFSETVQPRLFRREADLAYIGRLHPRLEPSLEEAAKKAGKHVSLSGITLRHHAYMSVLSEDKLRWAARLFELELKDRPGQLHHLIEYGRTLLLLNDPKGHRLMAQAAEQVLAARAAPTAPNSTVARLLEYVLTVSPEQSVSHLSREEALELALRWFPASPPLLWKMALQDYTAKNFRRAGILLRQLVQLGRTGTYDRSASFDPTIIGESALMNLGNCYLQMGQLESAQQCYQQLLDSKTYQTAALQNIGVIQRLQQVPKPGLEPPPP
jgi:tetratricopeptide (TPR) repeat protein